jgi:lipopolysaccharide/colanic/teichoic acid biosynthesis glycosyltransferase
MVSTGGIYPLAKRAMDFSVAVVALGVLALPLLVVALLVRQKLGAPVLFRQERAGLRGAPFHIFKFRTMTNQRGSDGELLSDAERLTRFGGFLRSTSIDELPSLINVVRGDLSLVGPRPLFVRYIPRYTPEQMRRLDVLPGLTGWAQAKGRNSLGWDEKFALDNWYIDNRSLWLDLKIIAITGLQVLRRHGISAADSATMPEFMGREGDNLSSPSR